MNSIIEDRQFVFEKGNKGKPSRITGVYWLKSTANIIILMLGDVLCLIFALYAAYLIRSRLFPILNHDLFFIMPPDLMGKVWWIIALQIVCFAYERVYRRRLTFWREAKLLIMALSLTFVFALAMVTLAKVGGEISRSILIIGFFLSLIIVTAGKYILKSLLYKMPWFKEEITVLFSGSTGEKLIHTLKKDGYLGYQVNNVEITGSPDLMLEAIEREVIRKGRFNLIIAMPELSGDQMVELVNRLQPLVKSVVVVPDLQGIPVLGAEVEYFFNERIMAFRMHNNLANPLNRITKMLFDLLASVLLLIFVLPIMGIIALFIKIDSPGPVFFVHRRIGYGGREFNCYKFRTMRQDAEKILADLLENNPALKEEWEREFKLKDDPRITRVGRFLRRTSLDELPQFINIWKREMSLVGPRPIVRDEIPKFGEYFADYCLVRPGLTGLWQVSGRNDVPYPERVRLESWYVHNWSIWLDIIVLLKTIVVVLKKEGVY